MSIDANKLEAAMKWARGIPPEGTQFNMGAKSVYRVGSFSSHVHALVAAVEELRAENAWLRRSFAKSLDMLLALISQAGDGLLYAHITEVKRLLSSGLRPLTAEETARVLGSDSVEHIGPQRMDPISLSVLARKGAEMLAKGHEEATDA